MPDACMWLGPPWLNLSISLALTICESRSLFFVSLYGVNLTRLIRDDDTLQ